MKTWMWIVLGIVVVVGVVSAYVLLQPNPNVGDRTKLSRTYSAEEQRRIDTVTIPRTELAAATCQNGAKCYVAVNGVVYDMNSFPDWMKSGVHHGVAAGTDGTEAFVKSGHARDKLQGLPVVGRLGS